MTVAETGAAARPGLGWHLVLKDDALRSYASLCRDAVPQAWGSIGAGKSLGLTRTWHGAGSSSCARGSRGRPGARLGRAGRQDLSDSRYQAEGKFMPRRTIFTVAHGCRCVYKYSGAPALTAKPLADRGGGHPNGGAGLCRADPRHPLFKAFKCLEVSIAWRRPGCVRSPTAATSTCTASRHPIATVTV